MTKSDYRTPGQLLQDLLDARGWSQSVLAAVLDVDKTVINKILNGKRSVDATIAITLSEVFDIEPTRFMELQLSFDLAQAQITSRPDPSRANRAHLFANIPVPELMKRGWIKQSNLKNTLEVEKSLIAFFEVDALDEIEFLPHAAKKTNVAENVTASQLVWLYRVRSLAREMLVPRYTNEKGHAALKKLSELRHAVEEVRHVPRILAEAGIRYIIVEGLKNSQIDGVCLWLDDHSPVIGMSLRFDRIDNFWFVLRHELEHVIRGEGRSIITVDSNLEGANGATTGGLPDEEKRANAAGSEFCVPQKMLDQFIRRKAPLFSERDVRGLANMLHVHPGLVAGQIRRHTGRYELFSQLVSPIKKHLAPSALVDGWGDIPPVDQFTK